MGNLSFGSSHSQRKTQDDSLDSILFGGIHLLYRLHLDRSISLCERAWHAMQEGFRKGSDENESTATSLPDLANSIVFLPDLEAARQKGSKLGARS